MTILADSITREKAKKFDKAFWIVIVAVITCLAVALSFLTNPKTDKVDTTKSGSELDGLSVEVVSLNTTYIGIKWINNTENNIIFGEEFYIYKQKNGKWKDCRQSKEYAWNAIAYSVDSSKETVHEYNLAEISVMEDGKYRFESNCFIDGNADSKYKVWVQFEIKNGTVDALFMNDGEVFFYSEATDEHDTPVIKKHADFGDEFDSFLKILRDKKWVNDNFVDRIAHNYDGKISFSGNWIYFGYEHKVIYYDHYFCTATNDVIKLIKDLELGATKYASETKYVFSDSIDPIKPSIILCHNDGTFQFNYSGFSSYIAIGRYEYEGKNLILRTNDGQNTYVFKVNAQNTLVFDASKSSKIPEYRYSGDSNETYSPVPDGAVFAQTSAEAKNQNPYFNATVLEVYENSVLVEPFKDEEIRKSSDQIYVGTDVISTNPVPNLKKGMQIRVVYNGNILESYPASLGGVFAIYELDKNGEVIFIEDIVRHIFDPVEICYSNGMYSYVADVEGLPTYEIINNMELYEMEFNGPHNLYGEMTEIKLTEEKFDSRFQTDMWNEASNIRKNNKTAWEIYAKHGEISKLYLLLEQNDGTFYLAVGYYNMGSVNPSNSDDSLIRWVYRLKEVDSLQQANPEW